MIIDFDKLDENLIEGFKGGKGILRMRSFFDGKCRIMRQVLSPGVSSGLHTHENNCEIIFVLKGELTVYYDETVETLVAGQVHYCPAGHSHYMENRTNGEVECFAIVADNN